MNECDYTDYDFTEEEIAHIPCIDNPDDLRLYYEYYGYLDDIQNKPEEDWDCNHYIGDLTSYGKIVDAGNDIPFKMQSGILSGFCVVEYEGRLYDATMLIARAFLENDDPLNKTNVFHIDNNPYHNAVWNLKWMTPAEAISKQPYKTIWSKVKYSSHHSVSNNGFLRNDKTCEISKPCNNCTTINLHKNGRKYETTIHQLIKETFKTNK